MVVENKWIVVTGANRGLGYELCKQLLEHKHPVVAACRTLVKAEEVVARLRADTGHDITVQPLELDPSDASSIERAVESLRETRNQKVGVLVNNAGIMEDGWSSEIWENIMAVNFRGPVALAEQLLPVLAEGGRVVSVSSGLSQFGEPGWPSENYKARIAAAETVDALREIGFDANDEGCIESGCISTGPGVMPGVPIYRISKALLNQATALLARDPRFVERNVTISAVCPGHCRTGLGSGQDHAQLSAVEGASSIRWNVEHDAPQDINGKLLRFDKLVDF